MDTINSIFEELQLHVRVASTDTRTDSHGTERLRSH